MDEFLWMALAAGLGVAALTGPLGSFVVWRKMAYLGDTLAHSSLLGIALGLLLNMDLTLSVLLASMGLACVLVVLGHNRWLAQDTLLGILAHSALSLGMIALSMMTHIRVDLMAYLFGDLLAVQWQDLYWIYGGGGLVGAILAYYWKPLLAITLSEELAHVDGLPIKRLNTVLMLLISIVIALAMKFVGALIITSLLIIPAATARVFSRTPEQMALLASGIGMLSVVGGLLLSAYHDTPAGPSVVVVGVGLFLLSQAYPRQR